MISLAGTQPDYQACCVQRNIAILVGLDNRLPDIAAAPYTHIAQLGQEVHKLWLLVVAKIDSAPEISVRIPL